MNTNTPQALENISIVEEWSGTKIPLHERGKVWYIVAGTLVVAGVAYGLYTGSWLFSLVCALAAGVHYRVHTKDDHSTHRLGIAKEGVIADGTFLRWQDLQGFWLIVGKDSVDIRLPLVQSPLRELRLIVPLAQEQHVRLTLSQFTTALHDRKENIFDMISRICKI